ncbi:MAG: hypothetical protein ACM362_09105 [Candidatus Methylomirabilota bacterium]
MTLKDMGEEMKTIPTQGRTWLDMYYHISMLCSGTTCMPLTELCVAGGSVRPMDPGKANMDMGKASPGNQCSITVYKRYISRSEDNIFLYQRLVELPKCM